MEGVKNCAGEITSDWFYNDFSAKHGMYSIKRAEIVSTA
jgi:hypothetical protein